MDNQDRPEYRVHNLCAALYLQSPTEAGRFKIR